MTCCENQETGDSTRKKKKKDIAAVAIPQKRIESTPSLPQPRNIAGEMRLKVQHVIDYLNCARHTGGEYRTGVSFLEVVDVYISGTRSDEVCVTAA